MEEQNSAREKLRKVLEECTGIPGSVAHRLNPMRAAVLLDALDNPELDDLEFYEIAAKILGPKAEDLPAKE